MKLHAIVENLETARVAMAGGATVIQVRLKERPRRELVALAAEVCELCQPQGLSVVVNDDVEAAHEVGADYVHVGQADLARLGAPPKMPFGLSAATVEEGRLAEQLGATYVGAGPIWGTPSKADADPPIGLDGLTALRRAISPFIVAIGGIDSSNAADCIRAGANGVAVIRAVAEIEALRAAIDAAL